MIVTISCKVPIPTSGPKLVTEALSIWAVHGFVGIEETLVDAWFNVTVGSGAEEFVGAELAPEVAALAPEFDGEVVEVVGTALVPAGGIVERTPLDVAGLPLDAAPDVVKKATRPATEIAVSPRRSPIKRRKAIGFPLSLI